MKIKLFFLLVFMALSMSAKNISLTQAQRMAMEFFRSGKPQLAGDRLRMVRDGETDVSRSAGAPPAFYVFNNPDGKGFVIVAGDDLAEPILGYSYEHDFPEGNLPTNVEAWLQSLKNQINDGRKFGAVSKPSSRSLDGTGEVVVQLETALWNQGYPYNQFCPVMNDGGYDNGYPPTGCVITATAIVMKYHQWPQNGVGTLPEYTFGENNIKVPAVQLGHVYDWKQMPLEYGSGKYTVEQGEQVARLMADLGVMLQASYNKNGTSASTYHLGSLLPTYMGYDKSALHLDRSDISEEDWHRMLQQELQAGRPIIYDGHNEEGGHAFVLDGYTTEQFYGVNWGWGGYCNGYFLLNALIPQGSGVGGNNDHYNFNQSAVIGLKPDDGGDYVEKIIMGESGLSSSAAEFERNKSFEVVVGRISNRGGASFSGKILWALTDRNGKIKEELNTFECRDLQRGWGYTDLKRSCTITVPIAIGDRIRMFYKSEKTPEWTLVKGGDECVWELLVADEFTIEESTVVRYNKKDGVWTVTTKKGVGVQFVSEAGVVLNERCVTEGVVTTINTQGLEEGVYILKLEKTFEACDVRIRLGNSQM